MILAHNAPASQSLKQQPRQAGEEKKDGGGVREEGGEIQH